MGNQKIRQRDRVRTPSGAIGTVTVEGSDFLNNILKVALEDGSVEKHPTDDLELISRPGLPGQ